MGDKRDVRPTLDASVDWPQFLQRLVAGLRAEGNPIADDPVVLDQMVAQAARVLADLGITGVTGPGFDRADVLAADSSQISEEIGAARAFARIHPLHSIRAAHVLFDATLPIVIRAGIDDIAVHVSALHRAIVGGIAQAALGYVDTLLLELRNTRIEERRRMSRELHDEIAHTVGRALVILETAEPVPSGGVLDAVCAAMRQALDEVRRFSGELRRTTDVHDIEVALCRYLSDHGLQDQVSVSVFGDPHLVPAAYGEEIYFTLREAVRNAVAHGGGGPVAVRVHIEPGGISAEVTDVGRGIDAAEDPPRGRGQGIPGMRERIELLQGSFSVTSSQGRGTRVAFHVPLAKQRR